jgi:GNAT superfamily N-acetyltransferase
MQSIDIRHVERFPEPQFSSLQKLVFADIQVISSVQTGPEYPTRAVLPAFRLGAYEGAELVGWTYGWLERNNAFYMANSGVVASHRRRGIYTLLLDAVREHARLEGAWGIRSLHSVLNNPVIIAKLRYGYHVSGLSQSAQLGTLVELTTHLSIRHEDIFRQRVLPYAAL